jgi:putative flippase GtrA
LKAILDRDHWFGQLARFGAFGVLGAGTNFLVYWVGLHVGAHYVIASCAGWISGLLIVFVLNRRFNFRSGGSASRDLVRTFGVYSAQQAVVVAGLATGIEILRLDPLLAYFLVLPVALAVSFLGMKFFAMRASTKAPD